MKVQINVRGRRYTVKSDEDVDLHAIARYVDGKMNEIAARGSIDEYTVAMLACLNIASDFERFRLQVDAELEGMDRELASTAVLLDTFTPDPASEELP
jgi:cell division protein ZapA (FtsZ GTPase activity inhibitor)